MDRAQDNAQPASVSRAWLLHFGRTLYAAIGIHEMSELMISPMLYEIPCTPWYCSKVAVLRDRILPVLEIHSLLEGQKIISDDMNVVGVTVYQTDTTQPVQYGALHMASTPQTITVRDDQACELPHTHQHWRSLAIACFEHEGIIVPVLDFRLLFSKQLATEAQGYLLNG